MARSLTSTDTVSFPLPAGLINYSQAVGNITLACWSNSSIASTTNETLAFGFGNQSTHGLELFHCFGGAVSSFWGISPVSFGSFPITPFINDPNAWHHLCVTY